MEDYTRFFNKLDNDTDLGVREIMGTGAGQGLATYIPNIVYACPDGQKLTLELMLPTQGRRKQDQLPAPLIVFVQGSAWRDPNVYNRIPMLARFAKAGFAVASVKHRSSLGSPFMAFLCDVKSAIRFLRANSETYNIDPELVAIWGTSSGGNTALLTAVTDGMQEFEIGEHLEQSSSVQAVVDFFGPTDITDMFAFYGCPREMIPSLPYDSENRMMTLIGGMEGDVMARVAAVSPYGYLKEGMKKLPPHFLAHGDMDDVVPFGETLAYYRRMRELGQVVSMVKVRGGAHEAHFWTDKLLDEVEDFLNCYLV